MKWFIKIFITTYLLVCLPDLLGLNYVIDWLPEATIVQKIKGYLIGGLFYNFVYKFFIAIIVPTGALLVSKLLYNK